MGHDLRLTERREDKDNNKKATKAIGATNLDGVDLAN